MKHILIPTDLQQSSDAVWHYMLPVMQASGADIHFIHAVDDLFVKEERDHIGAEGVDRITSDLVYKMRAEADAGMERLLARAETAIAAAGIQGKVSGKVTNGVAEDVILTEAASIQPQLIVMGSHDHSKLDRLFFGSVTQAVLRKSHFPVLAIPENYAYKPIKEILYMSDLDNEDAYAVGKLINLFGAMPFKLHITHFNLDDAEKDDRLFAIGEKVRTDYKHVPVEYEVIDARILRDAYKQYTEKKKIDLIALTTRKNHGLSRFLNPGTAVDVLYHSKLPVLVFHKP